MKSHCDIQLYQENTHTNLTCHVSACIMCIPSNRTHAHFENEHVKRTPVRSIVHYIVIANHFIKSDGNTLYMTSITSKYIINLKISTQIVDSENLSLSNCLLFQTLRVAVVQKKNGWQLSAVSGSCIHVTVILSNLCSCILLLNEKANRIILEVRGTLHNKCSQSHIKHILLSEEIFLYRECRREE